MPSITCRCGESLSYGEKPNPAEWLMTSEHEYHARDGVVYAEVLIDCISRLLKCGRCERLWVCWAGPENEPVAYLPERAWTQR